MTRMIIVCLSVCLSVCVSVSMYVCSFIYLYVCLSAYLSVHLLYPCFMFVCMSIYMSIFLSIYMPVRSSVRPSVRPSVCLYVCMYVHPSVRLSVPPSVSHIRTNTLFSSLPFYLLKPIRRRCFLTTRLMPPSGHFFPITSLHHLTGQIQVTWLIAVHPLKNKHFPNESILVTFISRWRISTPWFGFRDS